MTAGGAQAEVTAVFRLAQFALGVFFFFFFLAFLPFSPDTD